MKTADWGNLLPGKPQRPKLNGFWLGDGAFWGKGVGG